MFAINLLMYLPILLINFLILFVIFFEKESKQKSMIFNIRIGLVKASIIIALISYIIVEILSIFNGLNTINAIIAWLIVLVLSIFYTIKIPFRLILLQIATYKWELSKQTKWIFYILGVLVVLPLFLLAICIPPNNWDSMAYHLPRVEHWIQNRNIYPYPTNIVRQVLTSPLHEYILTNLQLLTGVDDLFNIVQWWSFILIIILGTLIFSVLGLGQKPQIFVVLTLISLPMMIFQATTTQTDLLASFFFLAFVLFALIILKEKNKIEFNTNFFFLSLALCLGILTKYHIAIFAFPLCLYLFICLIRKYSKTQVFKALLISTFIACIILIPLFARNIYFFGSITGKEVFAENATIVNSSISIQNMLSNNFKHIVDFISLPINSYNRLLFSINHTLQNWIGISENAPGNNWAGEPFIVNNHLTEDTAGSFLHGAIIFVSLMLLFKIKKNIKLVLSILYCFIAFSLFSLLFRYTPFNIRLLLPVLLLLIIISTYILVQTISKPLILSALTFILILVATLPVYFNRAKPIIIDPFYLKRILSHSPKASLRIKNVFEKNKMEHYFTQNPVVQKNIDSLFSEIPNDKNKIDLKTEFDSYEYLIWVYSKNKYSNFYIGNSDIQPYKTYSKNIKSKSFYNLEIADKNKNWSFSILK